MPINWIGTDRTRTEIRKLQTTTTQNVATLQDSWIAERMKAGRTTTESNKAIHIFLYDLQWKFLFCFFEEVVNWSCKGQP